MFDKSARKDGTLSRADFTYDHDGDVYFCPSGKTLRTKGTLVNDGATLIYRQQVRLHIVSAEAEVLPQGACPQDPTLPL